MASKKKNLDIYLSEVYKQFISIKDDDFKKSQEVFNSVFEQVKKKMCEQCNYFSKYSSQVLYGGSVYDGIKISKLDEFDMDIVIRLPINYEEVVIVQSDQPGFVKLQITNAFDNLDKQPDWEKCHKVTRDWRDGDKFLLQSKFRQWMHGIVQKAVNELNGKVTVNEVMYLLKYKESGPAFTLNIRNVKGDEHFLLDVDLVPVIRFQHPRWPEGYRCIEGSQMKNWLLVPKPNKAIQVDVLKSQHWRLSFQEFEKELIKGCQQLKTTIRLLKKLRDALEMKAIASYYIKTLFLWKVHKTADKKYWQEKLSVLFRVMVEELYNAIKNKNIPYFWHEENNLIAGLKPTLQSLYASKLKDVLNSIDANDVEQVVSSLLTTEELTLFKSSEFYVKQSSNNSSNAFNRQVSKSAALKENDPPDTKLNKEIVKLNDKIATLVDKVGELYEKIDVQNERLKKLETERENKEECTLDKAIDKVTDAAADLDLGDYRPKRYKTNKMGEKK